ncbi:DUF4192 family protein [Luteococcus peritonei]|uniref:DUF4192 family protein n=1 Tax=Luteococcus peritonei TaxID=88874 RepID=A0ABW4S0Y7_9ACTN
MSTDDITRLGVRDTADLLALTPYLMGYQPTDRLVFQVMEHRRLHATGAVELEAVHQPEALQESITQLLDRLEAPLVLLAAWTDDRELGELALQLATDAVGRHRLLDRVLVTSTTWQTQDGRSGETEALRRSPVVAAAVVAGLSAAPTREAAVAVVQGPVPELVDQLEALHHRAEDRLVTLGEAGWTQRARTMVREALAGREPAGGELAELALLSGLPDVRESLWLDMTRRRAAENLDLWTRVVAQCPSTYAAGPVLTMGFAAWLAGEGALLGSCVDRALELGLDDWEVDVLEALSQAAVHPSAWERSCSRDSLHQPAGSR